MFVRTMSGCTRPADRQQRVAEFNAHEGPAVFVLTTRACGVGINLTAATRAIIAFPHYNPSHEAQAAARIHRLGQKNPVEIFRIVCDGAYDHKVMVRARHCCCYTLLPLCSYGRHSDPHVLGRKFSGRCCLIVLSMHI